MRCSPSILLLVTLLACSEARDRSTSPNVGEGASGTDGAEPARDVSTGKGRAASGPPTDPRTAAEEACPESQRRCFYRFKYADRGERRVELRGDFKAGGWVSGAPLERRGSTWTCDVEIVPDTDVQYKFLLDEARWIRDPANPAIAAGTDNSLLPALICEPYQCAR